MKRLFFSQNGQALVEVLVALLVAIIIISTITVAVLTSLNNANFSKNQDLANFYAQEAVDVLRRQRDSDWAKFFDYYNDSSSDYNFCLPENAVDLGESISDPTSDPQSCYKNILLSGTPFFGRHVHIERNSSQCTPVNTPAPGDTTRNAEVTVNVYWTDNKCPTGIPCHKVSLTTCFSDYTVLNGPSPYNSPMPTPTP